MGLLTRLLMLNEVQKMMPQSNTTDIGTTRDIKSACTENMPHVDTVSKQLSTGEERGLRRKYPNTILDFQHPELCENKFQLFKLPGQWYPVMATQIY